MPDFVVWNASPELFSIGPLTVRWYGMMFAVGFLLGYNILGRIFRHEGAPEKWLGILLMWVVGATIIGARLGHVFFYEWSYYSQHPLEILYVWEGGLASHGGTIAIILAVILFSIFTTRRNPIWTFDRLVIPIALVGGMIRLGNLMNSEIFGTATTLPWGFMFLRSREWHMLYEGQACHPTQIYEALCYFALFALLMWMYWRKNAEERPGLIFGVFLIGIFLPRFLIEFIKNDQVDFEADMVLNMGQLLSIPFILAGVALVIYAMSRPKVKLSFPNRFADETPQTSGKR
ncbi:MAG: prolipoprotein diacylglyceryl transferase [Barnesiella sp.]|nr:prolipoprotein diacylglyceryl transferase [Barnesiella sp.]MBD5330952.1 prolipoprotein diacylglyceryl transferase [Bacteroides sp.]MDE7459986.1 prolipoprotein diacylglyceryl transferase [Paramuribaculum sp.]